MRLELQRQRSLAQNHLWFPFARPDSMREEGGPIILVRGEGVWLQDAEGRRYLDGIGALEACAVGHGRERLAEVAAAQMRQMAFLDVFRYASQPAIELATELVRISQPNLNQVHFTPGGSEAVEVALKMAFQYHYLRREPSRRKVITRQGAFHGVTFGAMNCDGRYFSTRNDIYLGPTRFGEVATGPAKGEGWGLGARHTAGAEEFAAKVAELGPQTVAAIIVDPVATASAVACPPADDLRKLRALCDEHGILLIIDEIITGFGKAGCMFVSQLYGVEPDFLTVSKALSSGYMPIGATLVSDKVVEAFYHGDPRDNLFTHGHTYGGHPVACAVALENLRILEEERLVEGALAKGEYLHHKLRALTHHPSYADARRVGLLQGLEFLENDRAAGSFGSVQAAGVWLRKRCRDLGLITLMLHPGNVLLLAPPLIVSEAEMDQMVAIIDQALADLEGVL